MVGHPQFHSFAVFVDGHRITVKPCEKYYDRPVKSGSTVMIICRDSVSLYKNMTIMFLYRCIAPK